MKILIVGIGFRALVILHCSWVVMILVVFLPEIIRGLNRIAFISQTITLRSMYQVGLVVMIWAFFISVMVQLNHFVATAYVNLL
ncbi:unnamed protein product [Linum tenue]|uniref:Uncharacterized protein n=1 Tax=Linum tenue TaxID=586396 RepID=A0AAV0IEL3_9ROSI|nr:unnamed protein product [Linum tenue]